MTGDVTAMALSQIAAPVLEPLTEAEVAAHLRLDAPNQEPPPATAPTVALAGAGAGLCTVGSHVVAVSFVDEDGGETPPGPVSAPVTVADAAVNGQIAVSAIPTGGDRIASRKVWMTKVGETILRFAATIGNNTATTTTLNLADASLGASAPTANTTSDPTLAGYISAARERAEDLTGRQLLRASYELHLDTWPCEGFIEVPKPPLLDVTSIQYRDTAGVLQTWATDQYLVQAPAGPKARRGRITPAYGVTWPSTRGQMGDIIVTFDAGYGDTRAQVPRLIRQAIQLIVGTWYEQRENDVLERQTTAIPKISLTAERVLLGFRIRPETRQEAA